MLDRILALSAFSISMASASDIRLSGTVYDDVGNPVFGATVALVRAGDKAYTNPKGEWRLEGRRDSVVSASGVLDTLLIALKDTAFATFPIATYIQTGSVQVLPTVHLGKAPGSESSASLSLFPATAPSTFVAPSEAPLQIPGPFGPTMVPVDQADAVIANYRRTAKIMHKVDQVFIVGGLAVAGVGGAIALAGGATDSDDLILWGAVTGACGLLFAVIPLGHSQVDELNRNADDLQRQLDERRHRGANLRIQPILGRHANAGLAMRLEF